MVADRNDPLPFVVGGLKWPDAHAAVEPPPAFVDQLPVAVFATDASGAIVWANHRAEELWAGAGANNDDRRPLAARSLGLVGPLSRVLATGEPIGGVEAIIQRPGGARAFATASIQPVKTDDGQVAGAITCLEDTTALHDAEARLTSLERDVTRSGEKQAESAAYLGKVLDALPVAVYTTDAAGIVTFYNKAAGELSGRQPKVGLDRWCITWRLYTPDGLPLPLEDCPMAVALKEKHPVRGVEVLVERPDGVLVPVMPHPTPITDRSGRLIGAVNVLIDLSEQKRAEADQAGLVRELNHRVKNNMQMLLSLLSSAARDSKTAEARQVLEDAERRVAVIGAAQQVLYGGENSGTSYGADDLVRAVIAIARVRRRKPIAIDVAKSGVRLSNDTAVPVALMLNELLANAVKHGTSGGQSPIIHIALERRADQLALTVSDDGPGFALEATGKRASGLGLVAGLARQLSGLLTVEPADGGGARCTITFHDRTAQ